MLEDKINFSHEMAKSKLKSKVLPPKNKCGNPNGD